MVAWLTMAGLIVVAVLGWNLFRRFGADRIAELMERRREGSRMVSRGEYVDGNRHLDVALAVTQSAFFYENSDMQAHLDLQWIREIEYDSELATGTTPPHGEVLRIRSSSQTFEFVLPEEVAERWHINLPPRRALRAEVAHA